MSLNKKILQICIANGRVLWYKLPEVIKVTKIIIIAAVAVIVILSVLFFVLSSCKSEKYHVICNTGFFENVKNSYKAGQQVKIYFSFVATDTDYSFYLDGAKISPSGYSDNKGYTISFVMPSHDVELTYNSKNSMEYIPVAEDIPENTSLFTYTKKVYSPEGNSTYKLTVKTTDSPTEHLMTVQTEDGTKQLYSIPRFPYESVYTYISNINISDWNSLTEYDCLDGTRISISVFCDGEYVNVSTDRMPEGGEQVLNYIHSFFADYMTEQNLQK